MCNSNEKFPPLFGLQNYLTLLDDEDHTLESLKVHDEQQLVIEGMSLSHVSPELIHRLSDSYSAETAR